MKKNDSVSKSLIPTAGPGVRSWFSDRRLAEGVYVEQFIPASGDAPFIYWSGTNFYIGERGGYLGLQNNKGVEFEGTPFYHNNIFSIWDLEGDGPGHKLELEYASPGLFVDTFGGEGTGLRTLHPMPWETDTLYGIVIRRWYKEGEDRTHTGMFLYSFKTEIWTHYVSLTLPERDAKIEQDNFYGFLELFWGDSLGHHGAYGSHFRLHEGGIWDKPIRYEADAVGEPSTWKSQLFDGERSILITAGGTFDNQQNSHIYHLYQPEEKPRPVKVPVVSLTSAICTPSRIAMISWSVDMRNSPQLSYTIEIKKNREDESSLVTYSDIFPHIFSASFELPSSLEAGEYVAKIIVKSIFEEDSQPSYLALVVPQ